MKDKKKRIIEAKQEIEEVLKKHNCSLIARPHFKLRDDGTWSVVTTVEVVPN